MVYEIENDNVPFYTQFVSVIIILIDIIVFIVQLFDPTGNMFVYEAAFIPSEFFRGEKMWTIFTSMFMHGDFFHILFNMWFLYIFGTVSARTFILIYFVMELIYGLISLIFPSGTAHFAHVGGFIAGVVFALLFKLIKHNKY